MSQTDRRVRLDPNIRSVQLDDGTVVVLHLETQSYYTLNPTGSRIWALVKEEQSQSQIASKLASEYDITVREAKKHVESFVRDLMEEGLIVDNGLKV